MANEWTKRWVGDLVRAAYMLLLALSIGCCPPCTLTGGSRRGSATITDAVLTTGVNADLSPVDNVTRFDPSVSRIWCVITLSADTAFPMGVRWYYRGELIRDYRFRAEGSPTAVFLDAAEGRSFPEGEYRVELYFVQKPDRVLYFTVGR